MFGALKKLNPFEQKTQAHRNPGRFLLLRQRSFCQRTLVKGSRRVLPPAHEDERFRRKTRLALHALLAASIGS